jgi:hypothetical protein
MARIRTAGTKEAATPTRSRRSGRTSAFPTFRTSHAHLRRRQHHALTTLVVIALLLDNVAHPLRRAHWGLAHSSTSYSCRSSSCSSTRQRRQCRGRPLATHVASTVAVDGQPLATLVSSTEAVDG